MILSVLLFITGILGFVLNRRHLILILISVEIILLASTLIILVSCYQYDDVIGQVYSIFIISVAAAESAIGLGIIIAFYRLRGTISLDNNLCILILY